MKGLPDVVAITGRLTWWLELKVVSRPKRLTTPWRSKVTVEQRRFLNAWNRAGGNAGVLVYDNRDELLYLLDPNVPDAIIPNVPAIPAESGSLWVNPWVDYARFSVSLDDIKTELHKVLEIAAYEHGQVV